MQNKKLLYILGGVTLVAIIGAAVYFSSGTLFKGAISDLGELLAIKQTTEPPPADVAIVTQPSADAGGIIATNQPVAITPAPAKTLLELAAEQVTNAEVKVKELETDNTDPAKAKKDKGDLEKAGADPTAKKADPAVEKDSFKLSRSTIYLGKIATSEESETSISFKVKKNTNIRLQVLQGATVIKKIQEAIPFSVGEYPSKYTWNGDKDGGGQVDADKKYVIRLEFGSGDMFTSGYFDQEVSVKIKSPPATAEDDCKQAKDKAEVATAERTKDCKLIITNDQALRCTRATETETALKNKQAEACKTTTSGSAATTQQGQTQAATQQGKTQQGQTQAATQQGKTQVQADADASIYSNFDNALVTIAPGENAIVSLIITKLPATASAKVANKEKDIVKFTDRTINTGNNNYVQEKWDGRVNGKDAPAGDYFFQIDIKTGAQNGKQVTLKKPVIVKAVTVTPPPPAVTTDTDARAKLELDIARLKAEEAKAKLEKAKVEAEAAKTRAAVNPAAPGPVTIFVPSPAGASATTASQADPGTLEVSPKTFSPNGDNENDFTTITVKLNTDAELSLKVLDRSGKTVKKLENRNYAAGTVKRTWSGDNEQGQARPDGLYIVRAEVTLAGGKTFEVSKNVYLAGATAGIEVQQHAAAPAATTTAATASQQPVSAKPACERFVDVNANNPFYAAIEYGRTQGIFSGYASCKFGPFNQINRVELLKAFFSAFKLPITSGLSPFFQDVKNNEWFDNLVNTAKNENRLQGYPDGTFKPGNNITNAETIKLLLDMAGKTDEVAKAEVKLNICPDVRLQDYNKWFMPYFQYATNIGLRQKNDNCAPAAAIKRGAVAEWLYVFLTKASK